MGEQGSAPERSDEVLNGDQDYDEERCRVLDLVVRIIMCVSLIDHYIEEYLADANAKAIKAENKTREQFIQDLRRKSIDDRYGMIKSGIHDRHTSEVLEAIKQVRGIRNDLAHSTVEVNPTGTTGITMKKSGHNVSILRDALKNAEECERHLKQVLQLPEREQGGR